MNSNNQKIIVAVDGPAGSGKSSVCRKAALEMGVKYIDSGAIYRAITWYFMDKYGEKLSVNNPVNELSGVNIEQTFEPDGNVRTLLNGKDISVAIRDEKVAEKISFFSNNKEIRAYVSSLLRKWAGESSIIMDGRDIGTVVFPDADLKVYLDASVDVRTERRVKEYTDLGKNVDENSIRNQIIQRDFKDENREFGPLKKAKDSVYLDTSSMTFNDVIEKLKDLIKSNK
ncbi:MAG TPA: (d)CMP kinase [Spirochaetota bacterium]|nr:(d)CMP kinase [Spirochaetota bacterium]